MCGTSVIRPTSGIVRQWSRVPLGKFSERGRTSNNAELGIPRSGKIAYILPEVQNHDRKLQIRSEAATYT